MYGNLSHCVAALSLQPAARAADLPSVSTASVTAAVEGLDQGGGVAREPRLGDYEEVTHCDFPYVSVF
eukprot:COSAG01_NODE_14391_length_1460_cov_2.893461_1_plen_68_part_00